MNASRSSPPRQNDEAPTTPDGRAALALWIVLAALAAARAALAYVPSMEGWSLNLLRFTPPVPGWTLWALAAVALVPRISRSLSPLLERLGDAAERRPLLVALACGVGISVLLWWTPDRVWFKGDFIYRNPAVASGKSFDALFYENLPLDNTLHATLPRALSRLFAASTDDASRMLGALEGGVLAMLALAFARAAGARGAGLVAGAVILGGGGYLTMYTGFAKSAGELCLLTLVFGIGAIRVLRGRRGMPLVLLAAAAGIALHRSAIFLVPIAALLAALAWKTEFAGGGWRRPWLVVSLVAFVATLGLMLPRIVAIIAGFDVSHHVASLDVRRQGGTLRSAFSGLQLLDLANALVALCPLIVATPVVAWFGGGSRPRPKEAGVLAAIVLYYIGTMFFLHPQGGLMRAWDVFASTGIALSMLTAWMVVGILREAPERTWLSVPVILATVSMTGLWLVHETWVPGGLARARAFIAEAPHRSQTDASTLWLYVGDRTAETGQWAESAEAMRRAAEDQPSPSVLFRWGTAATMAGDPERAREAWKTMTARLPAFPGAWGRLALVDLELQQFEEARAAARELVRLEPGDSLAAALLEHVELEGRKRGRW